MGCSDRRATVSLWQFNWSLPCLIEVSLRISSLQALSTALRDVEDALILGKAPSTSPPSAPMQAKKKGAMPSGPYNRSRYQIYATDTKKALCELYSFCFTLVKSP